VIFEEIVQKPADFQELATAGSASARYFWEIYP
jgi:hypothetical protein